MLNAKAYLTIDDSPSARMDDLVSYLEGRGIPALFFCRGDRLEENPEAAIRAVRKGFALANHSHSHQRSSERDADWIIGDIEKAQTLLDKIYQKAGAGAAPRYFRFPHVDRGTGAWIVDYNSYAGGDRAAVMDVFTQGLNVHLVDRPDSAAFAKKQRLQDYLKEAGYTQPFRGVTHRWYAQGEIGEAYDCLYSYSNCDWMLTERHQGKWPYKTVADLKARALADPFLREEGGVNVLLAHDQAEIVDITIELIEDLAANGLEFLEV